MLPVRYGLKQAAKLLMQHRIEADEKGQSVLIAAANLHPSDWEDTHEFRLHGKLYDVSDAVYIDGQKYYRCFDDELEVRMEHSSDHLASNLFDSHSADKDSKLVKSLIDWLQDLYYQPVTTTHCVPVYTGINVYGAKAILFVDEPFADCRIVPPEA